MKITDENVKKRLDVYVFETLGITRSSAQGMIDAGLVTVNGKAEGKNYRLRLGDDIEIEEQEPKELNVEAENIPLDIVFEDDDIIHVDGSIDAKRDIETINLELILSDMEMLDRRIDRTTKAMKGDKSLAAEVDFLKRVKEALENERPARSVECTDEEKAMLSEVALLTSKPVIYACNMSEDDFVSGIDSNENYKSVIEIAKAEGAEVLPICAGLEAEISSLSDEDKEMFLSDLGIERSGLDLLIQRSYNLLGLISYLTAGQPEVRAWTIKKGTKAPQAAGKIHSDFERGFIRAEVVSFENLMACGTLAAAKEKGLVKSEGKEYVMKDGDIVHFLFNV